MLVSLPVRVPVHLLDFGHLVDGETGERQRHLGRGTLRVTADFPESCTAHALPGRLAAHVSDLKHVIETDGVRQEAVVILPSYVEQGDGVTGTKITVQRIVLEPNLESPDRPGDSTRSGAAVFDWRSFNRLAPNIIAQLGTIVSAAPVMNEAPARRLQMPRPTLELRARPARRLADLQPASRAMLSAIVNGSCVRLNQADCADETAFFSALADVYEILPESLRGHVSAAAGLTLPDQAIQLAWSRGLISTAVDVQLEQLFAGCPPETLLAVAGAALFPQSAHAPALPAIVPAEARYSGEIVSTRSNSGIMPQVRHFMSDLAVDETRTGDVVDGWTAVHILSDLVGRGTSPARRKSLVDFAAQATREHRQTMWRACRDHDNAAVTTAAQMLCDESWASIDLIGLGAVAELAVEAQADTANRSYGAVLGLRVQTELAEFLRSKLLFSEPQLRTIAASDALSAMTSRIVAEDPALATRIVDSTAVVELMGAECRELAVAIRQRLAPRTGAANGLWKHRQPNAHDHARALSALIAGKLDQGDDVQEQVEALAVQLIKLGRRDVVVDAMRAISSRLTLNDPKTPAELALEHRRLDILTALTIALRRTEAAPLAQRSGVRSPKTKAANWSA